MGFHWVSTVVKMPDCIMFDDYVATEGFKKTPPYF